MADYRASIFCESCGRRVLATRPQPSHVLHLMLSLVTFGLWIPVWLVAAALAGTAPWRCNQCGETAASSEGTENTFPLAARLAVIVAILGAVFFFWVFSIMVRVGH